MRAGRERPGNGLTVDVALVDQRQAVLLERFANLVDPGSARDRDLLAVVVDVQDPAEIARDSSRPFVPTIGVNE